ncbi:MAG TPA: HAD-IIB family hydrolase [Candidatus Bathyarchaeia archaeon]|nr:HAD-IIB family hydrolase [Candidatus Bathyarchaeia archaeon]
MKLLATDVDNTLTGDPAAYLSLVDLLSAHQRVVAAYVTGRDKVQMFDIMVAECLHAPDYVLCNVGTEIYEGPDYQRDNAWTRHIDRLWDRLELSQALATIPHLFQQSRQFEFKQSYHLFRNADLVIQEIHKRLDEIGIAHKVVYSSGTDLDVIPEKAGKGAAVEYIRKRLRIHPGDVLAAGDSGNDIELLSAGFLAVVVGNHKSELNTDALPGDVYWARKNYAAGIIEGIQHFEFLESRREKASRTNGKR